MEITKAEIQFLLNAIDSHVRANGLNVSANALVIASKLQNHAKSIPDTEPEADGAE